MKKKFLAMLASVGAALAACGDVQTVTIDSSNAYAYTADNPLVCDSGSQITVKYSYREDGKTMKEALLDFIQVTPPGEGEDDPWVSLRVIEAGLTNDVDFSEQPYLWLGSVTHGNGWSAQQYDTLVGIYEPHGDVYRFGYDGTVATGEMGILVTNLVDNPVTGASRSILIRGKGCTCIRSVSGGTYTFTGSMTAEDGAYVSTINFGVLANSPRLVLRNGAWLVVKTKNSSLPETVDVEIDGTVTFYLSGGGTLPYLNIKGSVLGNGTIVTKDQGGILFAGTNNTFTGAVNMGYQNAGSVPIRFQVGDGKHFSWGGAEFTGFTLPRHQFVLNTDSNVTFSSSIPDNGNVYKMGSGAVTLTQPIDRSKAIAAKLNAFVIEEGTLVRGVQETTPMEGVMSLARGTSFDLGGIACESCYLPYGYGSVVNPENGTTVVLRGGWTNDVSFAGMVEGDVRVDNTGSRKWSVTANASMGDVAFAGGMCSLDTFSAGGVTGDVSVAMGARLELASDEYNRRGAMTGLALDFWKNVPSAASHSLFVTNCMTEITSRDPDLRTDMALFPNGVHSGETSGSDSSHPFAQALGSSQNYFAALFSGYFYAETDGEYSFSVRADDSGIVWVDNSVVVSVAEGGVGALRYGSVQLAQGWHPVRMLFCEEGGWEVFIVQVKRPGDSDYVDFPSETLKATLPGHMKSLAGDGEIVCAADATWPEIDDVSGFTGSVVLDANAGSVSGTLPLNAATIAQDTDAELFDGFWTVAQKSSFIGTNGVRAVELTPGEASVKGAVNSTSPITLGQPWSVSFDYSAVAPSGNSKGDGFFIGVHNAGPTAYDGGVFGYFEQTKRINQSTAYGLQAYLYPTYTQLVWVKDNNIYAAPGPIVTNKSLVVWNKIYENPIRVTMSYDGTEKLVVSFAQDGDEIAVTNSLAGADFAEKYSGGTAYIGIWGSNGGNFTRTLVENLSFSGEASEATPVLGGALELRGGAVTARGGYSDTSTLAADLHVTGAASLAADGVTLACTSSSWSFDLDNADAVLTVGAGVTLPAAVSADLSLTGEWPVMPRLIADFSDYEGDLPTVSIASGADVPSSVRFTWQGRKLYVLRATGTTIIIR